MPKAGDRIKVRANHWARGNQVGVVCEPPQHLPPVPGERFCIAFVKEGIGVEGRYLFLDELDFAVIGSE